MERARIEARSRLVDSVDSDDGVSLASVGDIHTEGRLLEAFRFTTLDWLWVLVRMSA